MHVTCTDLSTARGSVPIKTWLWNFDTGYDPIALTQTVNPYANYEYPGVRQISLTVTDANGATSTLSRPFAVAPPSVTSMSNNYNATVSSDSGKLTYFELDVPAGTTSLTAKLTPSNATETAWFYIKAGTPSTMRADCQQGMANGNPAICTIDRPVPGSYYVIVSTQSSLTRSTLTASYR
jgi:serine protease